VVEGVGYWYKLESIDSGTQSTFYGPLQVIAGVLATQPSASTATSTATNTVQAGAEVTATRTSAVTPTATRTPTRTGNAPLSQLTSTFSRFTTQTPTVLTTDQQSGLQASLQTQPALEQTPTIAASATIIPVPEITLQFPTTVVEPSIPDSQASLEEQNPGLEGARKVWLTLERLIFLGFILLVWVLLGGWFYLTYRRIEE